MRSFLTRWLVTTLAVWLAVRLTGMWVEDTASLFFMALVLGIINALLRPILLFLSLPFILVTLGSFILIVNASMFWFAGELVSGFHVGGFWNAFFGSIIVSVTNWLLSAFFRDPKGEYCILTRHEQVQGRREKLVAGRVIGE